MSDGVMGGGGGWSQMRWNTIISQVEREMEEEAKVKSKAVLEENQQQQSGTTLPFTTETDCL